jgi:ApaG protein
MIDIISAVDDLPHCGNENLEGAKMERETADEMGQDNPTAVTNNIKISVESKYSDSYSLPPFRYFFSYHITISNLGDKPVQLLSRRWIIKDAVGRTQQVEGPGVVGEQPYILPGHSYQYTSGCPLPCPYGEMNGTYRMINSNGEKFEAVIPIFKLLKVDQILH